MFTDTVVCNRRMAALKKHGDETNSTLANFRNSMKKDFTKARQIVHFSGKTTAQI
jgi:hypothetical protein